MSRRYAGLLAIAVGLALAVGSAARSDGDKDAAGTPASTPARTTVLVELFTSQGCSSCPPADRLLTELAADGANGIDVIALSYHVDYWNYIGWTDPFSSAEWTERQRRYAKQLARGRVYTPQLVVDGVRQCVGSNRADASQHIAGASGRALGAEVKSSRGPDDRLAITASLPATAEGSARVQVVVFETELKTEVERGENASRTLHNDNVVRRLTTVAELAPGEQWSGRYNLRLDPSWQADRVGVAVFVQSVATLEVLAATSERL